MTHPQPPVGPQDPQQPNPEPPTQAIPATPQPGTSDQWAPPTTPQPPYATSVPDQAWPQPPFSGGAYPVAGGPGHPLTMPPPVPSKSSKTTVVAVAVTAAMLALLCCAGGIVAVVIGANRAANQVTEALPTPDVTRGVGQQPADPPKPTPRSANGDTRNMSAGETLVVDGDDGTVEITVTKFSTATKPCKSYGLKPDEGMYVIADVTVTVTRGTGSANPLFFQWVAADGTAKNAVGGVFSGCGKPMPAGTDLTAGSRRTGSVVFDVQDTSGVLEYQHQFETAGSWKP